MTQDKLKQYIGLFGGALAALLLFLQSIGLDLQGFNENSINSFIEFLLSLIPFILVVYGVYKNSYVLTERAREHEKILKEKGLK